MIIEYQIYNFILKAEEKIELPPYKGSTFRGGFGTAFKKVVCGFKGKDCSSCIINAECAYAYIFETLRPENTAFFPESKYESIPHPFIIEPPLTSRKVFEPGEELCFSIILIGRAIKYLPFFVMSFEYLSEIGIGKGRSKYKLSKILSNNQTIYENEKRKLTLGQKNKIIIPESNLPDSNKKEEIKIRFLTPIRIKHQRKLVSKIEFFILITNLLRRIALLNFYHNNGQKPAWNHREIINKAKQVILKQNNTKWIDWERYSHRQKAHMNLGGVLGEVKYRGELEFFKPFLKAGEIFHVGKGTSFGLGKYIIKEDDS